MERISHLSRRDTVCIGLITALLYYTFYKTDSFMNYPIIYHIAFLFAMYVLVINSDILSLIYLSDRESAVEVDKAVIRDVIDTSTGPITFNEAKWGSLHNSVLKTDWITRNSYLVYVLTYGGYVPSVNHPLSWAEYLKSFELFLKLYNDAIYRYSVLKSLDPSVLDELVSLHDRLEELGHEFTVNLAPKYVENIKHMTTAINIFCLEKITLYAKSTDREHRLPAFTKTSAVLENVVNTEACDIYAPFCATSSKKPDVN